MTLIDILRDEPITLRLKRIFRGLKYPKGSPEYKYARYSLLCIFGPYAASAAASTLVILLSFLISVGDNNTVSGPTYEITIEDISIAKNDIKIDELQDTPLPDVSNDSNPDLPVGPLNPDISTPGPTQPDFSSNPGATENDTGAGVGGDLDVPIVPFAVVMTKSPVVLSGLYGNRTKGGRANALKAYGGGGGGLKPADGSSNTTEDAVLRALRWLKKYQETDGSWNAKSGGGPGANEGDCTPALTGLALLTYLAHGETPSSEEFGQTVERAIRWLVDNQEKDGQFQKRDPHNYSQPIASYALSEAFGMTQIPMVKDAAKKSVDVLIKGQHADGSWTYNCETVNRSDISYSGWCGQALKAAKMAGVENDGLDLAIQKAIQGYRTNFKNGVFQYEIKDGTPGDLNCQGRLTSVGTLCMQLLGAVKEPEARSGLEWLNKNATCDWAAPWGTSPIYYWYYTTQAKFHAGGDVWKQWNSQFSVQFVVNQKVVKGAGVDGKDIGYWEGLDSLCRSYVYNTTLCTLSLEVYYRYLPTFKPQETETVPTASSGDDIKVEIGK